MTAPYPPDRDGSQESLIAQHLKMFDASTEALKPGSEDTSPPQLDTARLPARRMPTSRWPQWLPWGLAVVSLAFAVSFRGQGQRERHAEPASSTTMTATASSSDPLLAQLLSAPPLPSTGRSSESESMLPLGAFRSEASEDVVSRFKGLSAGRNDPFRVVFAPPAIPSPGLPSLPKPVRETVPSPLVKPEAPPLVTSAETPPPLPSVQIRLLGVVDGSTPVALFELLSNGTFEKRRVSMNGFLLDGYQVAEITQRQIILHSHENKAISIPIGSRLQLPLLAQAASASSWPNSAVSH